MIEKYEETTGNKILWIYALPGVGTNTIENDVKLMKDGSTTSCTIRFSDEPFDNGNLRTGASLLNKFITTTGTEASFNLESTKKGVIWMYIFNNDNTDTINVASFQLNNI